jgi:2-hydroxy-3-oxopropionate reductase
MKLGFVGLGTMGIRMVRNLVKKGYSVIAYDIRKEAREEAAKMGALTTFSPKEVAQGSEVVLLSLPASPEVKDVIFGQNGIIEAAKSIIIVNLSTMDPVASVEVEERLKEYENMRFLDIPVSEGSFGA